MDTLATIGLIALALMAAAYLYVAWLFLVRFAAISYGRDQPHPWLTLATLIALSAIWPVWVALLLIDLLRKAPEK